MGLNHKQVHILHGNQFSAGAVVILFFVFVIEKEVQQFAWSATSGGQKSNWTLNTVSLCNMPQTSSVHPPELFVFCCFLFLTCLVAAAKHFGTSWKNCPFLRLFFGSPDRQFLITVGETLQRGSCSCWTLHAENYPEDWDWVFDTCTLPLCTPQPLPTDWTLRGIGWFWLSGTIPNKRGFSKCSRPTSIPWVWYCTNRKKWLL